MKKLICLLLCLMLLSLPVMVSAETTEGGQESAPSGEHVCEFREGAVLTEPSCLTPGEKSLVCSCGESKTEEIPAIGSHAYSGTKLDEAFHELVCSRCGDKQTGEHTWNSGAVTTAATCLSEGVKTYTCTACPAEKTEKIEKAAHTYGSWVKTDTKHSRECTVTGCGHKEEGNHNLKNETTKEPTCKETGIRKTSCTVCDYQVETVLEKTTKHTYDDVCDPDCNVCEETRKVSHSFTTVWSKNYTGHWHECTKCGEQKDFAKHIPGPAATEESDQLCVTCKYVVTPKKEHVHNYSESWTSDDSGHWHECDRCTVEKDFQQHDYQNACDPDCGICGYEREDFHTFEAGWDTSNQEHWRTCTECGEKVGREKHIPGAEADEEHPQLCTVCEFELAPVVPHVHGFGPGWQYNGDGHWQECRCGEASVPAPHNWDDGTKNRDKTVTYACTECRMERTEEAAGFPWWLLIAVLMLGGAGAGAYVILVVLPKQQTGKFSQR